MADERDRIPIEEPDRERIDSLLKAARRAGTYKTRGDFYRTAGLSRGSFQNMVGDVGKASPAHIHGVLKALHLPADCELVLKYLPDDAKRWSDEPDKTEQTEGTSQASRKPYWLLGIGGIATALSAVVIYLWPQTPQEEALSYLQDRGITLSHDDIGAALSTAEMATIVAMRDAGVPLNTFEVLLETHAGEFFSESIGLVAQIGWGIHCMNPA